MNLPTLLDGFATAAGEDLLHSTSLAVLGAFVQETVLETMELEYGYEDLALLDELAVVLRGGIRAWKEERTMDATVMQRGFVHAFLAGMDVAAQLHLREGEGLQLDSSLVGIFDGRTRKRVRVPLQGAAQELLPHVENAFVVFQDQVLKPVSSTRDEAMLLDFWAVGCLWASLGGVEAGLARVPVAG